MERDFAMNIASVALVVASVGVNFGWQPSKEDPQAYEVLMQVEPELVDVMAGGREIPIESHVPKSVTPIRNIRVVVGSKELPRTMIAAKTNRIVRGQEPSAVERTANFQGDPWGTSGKGTTTSGNRQYDQRRATIGVEPIRTAQNSPWTVEGAQQTMTDAGNSLRNSVDSNVQQVNQQFNQAGQAGQDLYDKTKDAASDFGNQLQSFSGFGGQTAAPSAPTGTAANKKSWAAPPLAASSSSPGGLSLTSQPSITPVGPAWSSIKPELAPPRLATPPLANGVRVASNPTAGRSNAGPAFPAPPAVGAPQQRSLLTDSSQGNSSALEGDWNSVWGTGASTNAGAGVDSDSVGMVPVPPRMHSAGAGQSQSLSPPPLDDRYSESNQAPPAASNGADSWANFGRPQNDVFNDPRLRATAPVTQPAAPTTPPTQPFAGQNPITQPTIGTQPPAEPAGQGTPNVEEVPWKPLLAVSLALAGSLGANFYLGMSYAEARHRYRSLVAKTTHAFEKKAGLAA